MKRLVIALALLLALLLPAMARPQRQAETCYACRSVDVGGLIEQG